jgi:hypothetical protein
MNRILSLRLILLLFFCCFVIFNSVKIYAQDDESEATSCVTCHTSAVKLIKITREIQKTNPPEAKSELNKGEG